MKFETIKDALAEFPEWKVIFQYGADSHFAMPAQRVSKISLQRNRNL